VGAYETSGTTVAIASRIATASSTVLWAGATERLQVERTILQRCYSAPGSGSYSMAWRPEHPGP